MTFYIQQKEDKNLYTQTADLFTPYMHKCSLGSLNV